MVPSAPLIGGRYNFKYTIACQISTGKICAILGPESGRITDIEGLRRGETAIISSWDPFEILLADKGYQGHPKCLTHSKENIKHLTKKLSAKFSHLFE